MEFMDTVAVTKIDPSHQGEILRNVGGLIDAGKLRVCAHCLSVCWCMC